MRRIQEQNLQDWFGSKARKPLVVRGARQVGKSTLIRNFAKSQGLRLIEINLEKKRGWNSLFTENDPKKVIAEIEGVLDLIIDSSEKTKDLLFLDECQATPAALTCLRYFFEEMPHLPVVAAGSLLEFALEKMNNSLPVGRIEFLFMGPMTLKEYLWAMGQDILVKKIEAFNFTKTLPTSVHERMLQLQREFLFIGGLPESISKYRETRSPKASRKIQSEILEVYKDDFFKYAKDNQVERLSLILDHALVHSCEKIKYSSISKDHQSRDLKRGVELLAKARILTQVYNTDSQGIPLKKGIDINVYKLIFLDVGLLNTGLKYDWSEIIKASERELLHEGVLAEQFVGQHMLTWTEHYESPELYYWLREGRADAAEVDYLFQKGKNIIAIEVKSGKSGAMKSLHQWQQRIAYPHKSAIRFDLNLPNKFNVTVNNNDSAINYQLISLPLYFASFNPHNLL